MKLEQTAEQLTQIDTLTSRMRLALSQAGIPTSIDWSAVLLHMAAQSLYMLGMKQPMFVQLGRIVLLKYAPTAGRVAPPSELLTPENFFARVLRVNKALQDAELRWSTDVGGFALINIAGMIASDAGAPDELWDMACKNAWNEAANATAQLAAAGVDATAKLEMLRERGEAPCGGEHG